MIHFEGDKSFPLPRRGRRGQAIRRRRSSRTACRTPRSSEATPDRAVWKLKPKLSFLTGSLNVEMTRTAP